MARHRSGMPEDHESVVYEAEPRRYKRDSIGEHESAVALMLDRISELERDLWLSQNEVENLNAQIWTLNSEIEFETRWRMEMEERADVLRDGLRFYADFRNWERLPGSSDPYADHVYLVAARSSGYVEAGLVLDEEDRIAVSR